ncbi:MAG: helix-turn-helix transcriptional regulator [Muribaculaceae bacterium]|nr:helix-turn-helix transcriptional regulator [Muribaculaceae bacterium]
MTKDINIAEYNHLLNFINRELRAKGLKATTMDSIASSYKISKRTLYEIFKNKDEMIEEAIALWHRETALKYTDIFSSSSNIMEAVLKCFLLNRDIVGKTSVEFFRDFHEFAKKRMEISGKKRTHFYEYLTEILKKGVEEGYFRQDIVIPVQCQLITIQMESLRRMEELFPENMSIVDVFDSIIITFLRGISTPKGIETLDLLLKDIA